MHAYFLYLIDFSPDGKGKRVAERLKSIKALKLKLCAILDFSVYCLLGYLHQESLGILSRHLHVLSTDTFPILVYLSFSFKEIDFHRSQREHFYVEMIYDFMKLKKKYSLKRL